MKFKNSKIYKVQLKQKQFRHKKLFFEKRNKLQVNYFYHANSELFLKETIGEVQTLEKIQNGFSIRFKLNVAYKNFTYFQKFNLTSPFILWIKKRFLIF